MTGNLTEAYDGPKYLVAKTAQIKDLQDQIVGGLGTYPIPAGITEETYRRGFSGTIGAADATSPDVAAEAAWPRPPRRCRNANRT